MREMKDSGVKWVGQIPKLWAIKPIRADFQEVTEKNKNGLVQNALKFTYGTIVQKQNFDADSDDYVAGTILGYTIVSPGDIVLNGLNLNYDFVSQRIGIVKDAGIITSAYLVFRKKLDSEILPEFINYLLKAYDNCKAFHNIGGGVRKIINFSELKKQYIVYPDIKSQRQIVELLDAKCAEIDALTADIQVQIDTLEQYKRSVITEAVTKGLNPDAEMRDSGLRWVEKLPAHWSVIPSKHLFHNSDLRKQPDDVLLTASQNWGIIPQEEYMERTGAKIVLANHGIENWKHVEPNNFVISLRSFQGGLEMSSVKGCITWHYIVLKPIKTIIHRFYKWLFKSDVYISALQSTCNFIRDGQDLRYSNFSQVPLYLPPLDEQTQIADYLDNKCAEIDRTITEKNIQMSVLADYKKSLIFEYVTGKKEVPAS